MKTCLVQKLVWKCRGRRFSRCLENSVQRWNHQSCTRKPTSVGEFFSCLLTFVTSNESARGVYLRVKEKKWSQSSEKLYIHQQHGKASRVLRGSSCGVMMKRWVSFRSFFLCMMMPKKSKVSICSEVDVHIVSGSSEDLGLHWCPPVHSWIASSIEHRPHQGTGHRESDALQKCFLYKTKITDMGGNRREQQRVRSPNKDGFLTMYSVSCRSKPVSMFLSMRGT